MITKRRSPVDPDSAAEAGKFVRDMPAKAIDGRLVVAGRFDFDESADGIDQKVAFLFEAPQARGSGGWDGCLSAGFRKGHDSPGSGVSALQYNLRPEEN